MGLILSLDSNTLVDLVRGGSPSVRTCYQQAVASGVEMMIPAVVWHELVLGVALSQNPDAQRKRMSETLVGLPVVDLSADDVEATGLLAAQLRRSGRPIGDLDTLIAGQALARGWTVVTRNIRHFGRVEGLPLIDWSVGPAPLSPQPIAARVSETD